VYVASCLFCRKRCIGVYCSSTCRNYCQQYEAHVTKYARFFWVGLFLTLMALGGALYEPELGVAAALLIFGLTVTVFPPEMPNQAFRMGVQRFMIVVGTAGIALAAAGGVMLLILFI
jgi:hypothetical protein